MQPEKIIGASKIARDITARKQAEAQIKYLARETEHRTKTYWPPSKRPVQLTHAENVAEFKKAVLEGRIQALASVHRLFVESRWAGRGSCMNLSVKNSRLYRRGDGTRVSIEGRKLLLEPNVAQTLAVVCHELATNAAKYGALSVANGRVVVAWTSTSDGRLVLLWTETGGPPVALPTHEGFGTRVVAKMVQQSKGEVSFDWRPEGLVCEVAMFVNAQQSDA